jgi:hypothetical protein
LIFFFAGVFFVGFSSHRANPGDQVRAAVLEKVKAQTSNTIYEVGFVVGLLFCFLNKSAQPVAEEDVLSPGRAGEKVGSSVQRRRLEAPCGKRGGATGFTFFLGFFLDVHVSSLVQRLKSLRQRITTWNLPARQ